MPKRIPPESDHATLRLVQEDMIRDLTRLIGGQEFGSLDEVNAFIQQHVAGKPLPRVAPTTDSERAEDLVSIARREQALPKLRAQVAKALALDPDCIAAHLLLAEVAESAEARIAHARNAIAAGDRVLAEELAEEGHPIWLHPRGRPYLNARLLLADVLWRTGDRQLALAEARTILRLNAGDNQGARYVLLGWLMRAGSVAEIDALLAAFDERSAAWLFTTALHQFRQQGPTAASTKALRAAVRVNAHVAPRLLGEREFPEWLPDTYGRGDDDEAVLYVHDALPLWFEAVGAMEWLEHVTRATRGATGKPRKRR